MLRQEGWFVVWLGASLALLTVAATGAPAQSLDAAKPAELFNRARPLVEEALGCRLEASPERGGPRLQPASAAVLRRLPDPELHHQLRWQFPELRGEALIRAHQTAAEVLRLATLARHEDGTNVIHLADAPTRMAEWHESLAGADSPACLQLALVHATARWVLSQRYDLARRWANCRDDEEFQVLQALVEGRALVVTRQVARRLGTEACFPVLVRCYHWVPDSTADREQRAVALGVLRRRAWAAERGLAFFDYLDQRAVAESEKRVFAQPPRQKAGIERPELYLRDQSRRPGLAEVLAPLERTLADGQWTATQQPWTPEMVRQVAGLLGDSARADKLLSSWHEGRYLICMPRTQGGSMTLGVARWSTPESARSYFGLAVDWQRKQDELMAAPRSLRRVLESRSASVRIDGMDQAVRYDKRIAFAPQQEPAGVTVLLIQAGELVVEMTWHGLTADVAWAESACKAIVSLARR